MHSVQFNEEFLTHTRSYYM